MQPINYLRREMSNHFDYFNDHPASHNSKNKPESKENVSIKEHIIEYYSGHVDDAPLFADGFDEAIIGICPNSFKVIYSRSKCIAILCREDDITEEDAMDYLEYNTFNTYVGEYTPIFMEDFSWA